MVSTYPLLFADHQLRERDHLFFGTMRGSLFSIMIAIMNSHFFDIHRFKLFHDVSRLTHFSSFYIKVGVRRIELRLHPPHGRVLPAYSTPASLASRIYLVFAIFLMHFVQALTLFPLFKTTHCKFGYFLFLHVGLYLLIFFFRDTLTIDVFPQREHVLLIEFKLIIELKIWQICHQ